jgi:hypothetical protein
VKENGAHMPYTWNAKMMRKFFICVHTVHFN